jgi:hypothetical protein
LFYKYKRIFGIIIFVVKKKTKIEKMYFNFMNKNTMAISILYIFISSLLITQIMTINKDDGGMREEGDLLDSKVNKKQVILEEPVQPVPKQQM